MPHATQDRVQAAPTPLRFTREEYYRMAEASLFVGRRVELLEGEVIEMTPQGSRHAAYARAGIGILWIVDLATRCVEVFEEPNRERSRYGRQQRFAEGASLMLPNGTTIVVSHLLPPA